MTQKSIEAVFEGLYAFTDIRILLRTTAPQHHLSDEQKDLIKMYTEKIRKSLSTVEEDLL